MGGGRIPSCGGAVDSFQSIRPATRLTLAVNRVLLSTRLTSFLFLLVAVAMFMNSTNMIYSLLPLFCFLLLASGCAKWTGCPRPIVIRL
ncbi:hypothetical protein CPB86DRAFT_578218 [Serendipita vermifera]|nr:hypothetical protein CPB86DRAFT_578218 [Serendipita vermifera]